MTRLENILPDLRKHNPNGWTDEHKERHQLGCKFAADRRKEEKRRADILASVHNYVPTPLDVYASEEAMCQAFWKDILKLQGAGVLQEHDVVCVSNNQRGGKGRSARAQAKDKAIGVTPGLLDYHVMGHGWLEAKRYKWQGKKIIATGLQPSQKRFIATAKACGEKCEVFYTPQQGISILEAWGLLEQVRGAL